MFCYVCAMLLLVFVFYVFAMLVLSFCYVFHAFAMFLLFFACFGMVLLCFWYVSARKCFDSVVNFGRSWSLLGPFWGPKRVTRKSLFAIVWGICFGSDVLPVFQNKLEKTKRKRVFRYMNYHVFCEGRHVHKNARKPGQQQ